LNRLRSEIKTNSIKQNSQTNSHTLFQIDIKLIMIYYVIYSLVLLLFFLFSNKIFKSLVKKYRSLNIIYYEICLWFAYERCRNFIYFFSI